MKFDDAVVHKIKYLCREIPKQEWSGVIFYDVEGSITDPTNMIVTVKDVFPMNKGVATYTEYLYDEELIDYRMDNPHTNFMKVGHMHSHNVMNTFFSGTDSDELNDNSEFHNYYLSVIVNNYFDVTARIAFRGEKAVKTFSCKDENGELYNVSIGSNEEVMFYYNCEVVMERPNLEVPDSFITRTAKIIQKAIKVVSSVLPAVRDDNSKNGKVVEVPGTNRKYLSDYLPAGFKVDGSVIKKEEPEFEFVNDEFIAAQQGSENIVYQDDTEEEEEDDSTGLMEDLLIDVMLSHPRIKKLYEASQDLLTLVDDVFTFIRPRVDKLNRDEYIKYVIENIPVKYHESFTASLEEFDNDYLIMIGIVRNLKEDYVNAQHLYQAMMTFLQEFRDKHFKEITNG